MPKRYLTENRHVKFSDLPNLNFTMSKKHRKVIKKQIHLDQYSIRKAINPDGEAVEINVSEGRCIYGSENYRGKYQAFLITPRTALNHIEEEFKFDGDFCFVDTNEIKNKTDRCQHLTHITGIFVFKVLEFKRSEDYTDIKIDLESRYLGFEFFALKEGDKPEIEGWKFAIGVLEERGTTKAKIFVDAFQSDLRRLGKDILPERYDFYYVSADRKHSIFNTIFSRLDKLINKVQAQQNTASSAEEAYMYLMEQIDHLQ